MNMTLFLSAQVRWTRGSINSHGIHQGRLALEAVGGLLADLIQEVKERNAKDENL
jgi:hypothetical protein